MTILSERGLSQVLPDTLQAELQHSIIIASDSSVLGAADPPIEVVEQQVDVVTMDSYEQDSEPESMEANDLGEQIPDEEVAVGAMEVTVWSTEDQEALPIQTEEEVDMIDQYSASELQDHDHTPSKLGQLQATAAPDMEATVAGRGGRSHAPPDVTSPLHFDTQAPSEAEGARGVEGGSTNSYPVPLLEQAGAGGGDTTTQGNMGDEHVVFPSDIVGGIEVSTMSSDVEIEATGTTAAAAVTGVVAVPPPPPPPASPPNSDMVEASKEINTSVAAAVPAGRGRCKRKRVPVMDLSLDLFSQDEIPLRRKEERLQEVRKADAETVSRGDAETVVSEEAGGEQGMEVSVEEEPRKGKEDGAKERVEVVREVGEEEEEDVEVVELEPADEEQAMRECVEMTNSDEAKEGVKTATIEVIHSSAPLPPSPPPPCEPVLLETNGRLDKEAHSLITETTAAPARQPHRHKKKAVVISIEQDLYLESFSQDEISAERKKGAGRVELPLSRPQISSPVPPITTSQASQVPPSSCTGPSSLSAAGEQASRLPPSHSLPPAAKGPAPGSRTLHVPAPPPLPDDDFLYHTDSEAAGSGSEVVLESPARAPRVVERLKKGLAVSSRAEGKETEDEEEEMELEYPVASMVVHPRSSGEATPTTEDFMPLVTSPVVGATPLTTPTKSSPPTAVVRASKAPPPSSMPAEVAMSTSEAPLSSEPLFSSAPSTNEPRPSAVSVSEASTVVSLLQNLLGSRMEVGRVREGGEMGGFAERGEVDVVGERGEVGVVSEGEDGVRPMSAPGDEATPMSEVPPITPTPPSTEPLFSTAPTANESHPPATPIADASTVVSLLQNFLGPSSPEVDLSPLVLPEPLPLALPPFLTRPLALRSLVESAVWGKGGQRSSSSLLDAEAVISSRPETAMEEEEEVVTMATALPDKRSITGRREEMVDGPTEKRDDVGVISMRGGVSGLGEREGVGVVSKEVGGGSDGAGDKEKAGAVEMKDVDRTAERELGGAREGEVVCKAGEREDVGRASKRDDIDMDERKDVTDSDLVEDLVGVMMEGLSGEEMEEPEAVMTPPAVAGSEGTGQEQAVTGSSVELFASAADAEEVPDTLFIDVEGSVSPSWDPLVEQPHTVPDPSQGTELYVGD